MMLVRKDRYCWSTTQLLLLPLFGVLCVLSLFSIFNIDHGLQSWLYQPNVGFPFQTNELYETWLHDRIKMVSNHFLWLVIAAALWPKKGLSWINFRLPLLLGVLAIVISVSVMHSLKDATGIYCPLQLKEYGGAITLHPKLQLGHLLIINDGSGRCWSAGHATAGFAWLALFFSFWSMGLKKWAYIALAVALSYGTFLGLVQVIRGQHFLSHQIYTMTFCWLISFFCFHFFYLLKNTFKIEPI